MEGINLKTIIYILFAIGWLYFKYLKRNTQSDDASKRSSAPENDTINQDQKGSIPMSETVPDKMNKDFIDSPKKEVLIPAQVNKVEYADDLFHKVLVDDVNRQNFKKENINDEINKDEAPLSHALLNDLDPKNMVVYHEIMKRPSY